MDIIIPHYNTSRYRERNLEYVLQYYVDNTDCNIILSEQFESSSKSGGHELRNSRVLHGKTYFNDSIFRKSHLINNGVACSTSEHVMLVDSDCILSKDVLDNISKYLKKYDYFVPFTHINFLNEGHTRQLVRTGHFTQARDKSFLHVNRYTGGCIVFTRELFDSVCGFPEEVLGWGKEDDIFLTKCKRIGAKIGRIEENNTLLHLFHTPSSTKEYMKSEQYLKNSKLLALFKRMKDEEFYQYIDDKEFILRDSLLENLYSKYDKEKKLETNVKVYCGTGFVKFDTSAYTIIPDENGNIGLEELFSAAYNEDGDESVAHTIREIDKNCRNLSPEHESIVKKYRDLITQ